jgi:hypothetical protein
MMRGDRPWAGPTWRSSRFAAPNSVVYEAQAAVIDYGSASLFLRDGVQPSAGGGGREPISG